MSQPIPSALNALTAYERNLLAKSAERFDELLVPDAVAPVTDSEGPLLMLCMTPRSGSSALSAALAKSKRMGLGGERLNRKPKGPLEQLLKEKPCATLRQVLDLAIVESRTGNGVAQIKCDFQHLYPFVADPDCLRRLRKATWVYLSREDILGQAISRFRGFQTGFWHATGKDAKGGTDADYDYDGIRKQVIFLAEMMAAFERTFAAIGVQPLRVTYEGLTADDGGTLQRIADKMGIEVDPGTSLKDGGHRKVAAANTDELRARFLADFERSLT